MSDAMRGELKRTYQRETLILCHPKMLLSVMCILSIGHFLSPYSLNVERYVLGLLGVALALLGIYRYNEISDFHRGVIPKRHHIIIGGVLLALGILIGIYLSLRFAWWIIFYLAFGAVGMIVYNVARSKVIHNRVFYGIIWGGFPFAASYCLQSLDAVPPIMIVAWAAFFSVLAVEILWSWGAMGCRHQNVCKRVKDGDYSRVCHSYSLTCSERRDIPKGIRLHTRTVLDIKVVGVLVLTIAVVTMKLGGM